MSDRLKWKPTPTHYTDHAVAEMRKARITRQTVRTVLATGTRSVEGSRGNDTYDAKTTDIRGRDVEVIYVENAERVLVVTVYRVGEYD